MPPRPKVPIKRFSISVPEDLTAYLDDRANSLGMTRSSYVALLLAFERERRATPAAA